MINLTVNIKEHSKSYPIYINNSNISDLKQQILQEIDNKNYVVIFSQKVFKLYGKELNFPKEKIFILKDGEDQKNFQNYAKILDFVLIKKLKRNDTIIAIGGGVVGDIAGFVASTYMRGINFIQVPTTLLAATDSSVGGKVAINSKFGKNLIGNFYQPKAVFINVNFLKTLDEIQFKSGLGEVIKYGFIEKTCNPNEETLLINFLSEHCNKILNKDILTLKELIKLCIKLKIEVVQKDETENNLRKILNYGHTYAHAIENITNYKKYTHGHCVIEGINFALKIALNKNLIDKEYKFLCEDLIKKFDYPPIQKFDKNKILNIMKTDKKSTQTTINFILPTDYAEVKEFKFTYEEMEQILDLLSC